MAVAGITSTLCLLLATSLSRISGQDSNVYQVTLYDDTPQDTFVCEITDLVDLSQTYGQTEIESATFSISAHSSTWSHLFNIDSSNGAIRMAAFLDRDSVCPQQEDCIINLDIAIHLGDDTQIVKLAVTVIDSNDNSPVFSDVNYAKSLPENTAVGYSFRIPTATDVDSPMNGIGGYELLSGAPMFLLKELQISPHVFDLHLVLQQPLDRETQAAYLATVLASDGANTGILNIDITVIDVNDNSPAFTQDMYAVVLPEDSPLDTLVVQVHAEDPDHGANGEVIYGLDPGVITIYGSLFVINDTTGQITLGSSLDYESTSEYNFLVTAKDMNPESLTAEARVVIQVTNVNDNAPVITVDSLTDDDIVRVSETAGIGAFVAIVRVQDPDTSDHTQISCSLIGDSFQLQHIFETEFKIVTSSILDRESSETHNITFFCSDGDSLHLTSSVDIIVHITDQNDNTPLFDKQTYSVVLQENNSPGLFLAHVSASDIDSGRNGLVTYSVGPEAADLIRIDPVSGNITAIISFDYEVSKRHEFAITAADSGDPQRSSSATLILLLTDMDDNLPRFSQDVFEFDIYEHRSMGTFVGQINATDDDSPPYDTFEFRLESESQYFHIDRSSGELFTRQPLDRERLSEHHLVVVAHAATVSGGTTTCQVRVYIADTNDNEPVVYFPNLHNNTVHIENNLGVNQSVVQITARDLDIGINGQLSYIIKEGNEFSAFRLDEHTGVLYVNGSLHRFDAHIFQLILTIRDNGYPQQSVEATLNIVVNKSQELTEISIQNLTIVISVVSVTVLLTVILVVAIVFVRQQGNKPKSLLSYSNPVLFSTATTAKEIEVTDGMEISPPYSNNAKHNNMDLELPVGLPVNKDTSEASPRNKVSHQINRTFL